MRLSFPENGRLGRKNRGKRLKMPFIGRCQVAIFEKNQLVWQLCLECDLFSASLELKDFHNEDTKTIFSTLKTSYPSHLRVY